VPTDRYGLPVTTASSRALGRYDEAVHELLRWGGRAGDLFGAAAAEDPELALAHAGRALCLFLDERFAEARAAGDAARTAAAGQSPRERSHVDALALFVSGRTVEAEQALRAHLDAYPRDFLLLQRLYFVWFWQGRFPEMLALTERSVATDGGNGLLLGLHAFALEEGDRLPEAMRAAEAAIAADPQDAWAVHALAHALYERAAFDAGIERLPAALQPCTHLGWFRDHLLWHLALMHLGRGDYARASDLARTVFEQAPSSLSGELHDSISLLWRLELCGRPVGARWQPFTALARERLDRLGLAFHVAHVAMALVGGGDWDTARKQLDLLRERAPRDRTGLLEPLVRPLIEGLHAFAAGDHPRAIARIEPLRPRLVQLGGSRAQRDVFHDTLIEACFRAGDTERAERLLAERIARRPEHCWLTRRARA
jgi:pentatricopeptide repeat protein